MDSYPIEMCLYKNLLQGSMVLFHFIFLEFRGLGPIGSALILGSNVGR